MNTDTKRKRTKADDSAKPSTLEPLLNGNQVKIDEVRFPDMADLIGRLRFSTVDGRIWLDDQRMLLIHAKAFGALRRELIESFGLNKARGLLSRLGYVAGTYDAQMARKVRLKAAAKDMFVVGPQLHCLEGIGLSEPVRLEFDIGKGYHYGEFLWTHQVEDEEHTRYYSIGDEPMCWMQIGYASGYSSEFMGRPILYREVECQSMGQAACRIVGQPLDVWGEDAASDWSFLSGSGPSADISAEANPPINMSSAQESPANALSPVGISPGFNSVMNMVRRVAPTNAPVLFLGETGVGKEVFARALHQLSSRRAELFVAVNCAAIPEQLIESELFGAARGAYTGATEARAGRFERAEGGTLFLDEIGTLSTGAQGNLLRALQEGEIERLGDTRTRRVNVRVIAATNVDLREAVKTGEFREDLFFRLNVFPIHVPPLRERREDLPLLVTHFLNKFNRLHQRQLTGFTQRSVDAIMSYDWPGNVRELENVIERGVILADEHKAIDTTHLFTDNEEFKDAYYAINHGGKLVARQTSQFIEKKTQDSDVERVFKSINNLLSESGEDDENLAEVSLDDIEDLLLKKAIERTHGNIAAAARLLGITRPQMVYRLKHRGIVTKDE